MSAFRKRKNKVMQSCSSDAHFTIRDVGDTTFVSQVFDRVSLETSFPPPSPTLDELIDAGQSPKDVDVSGIMDSYDINDTPLADIEEKIVTKGRKKKEVASPENEN